MSLVHECVRVVHVALEADRAERSLAQGLTEVRERFQSRHVGTKANVAFNMLRCWAREAAIRNTARRYDNCNNLQGGSLRHRLKLGGCVG